MDPEISCEEQPAMIRPCIRQTIEECETCTHVTYVPTRDTPRCSAISSMGKCSKYHFKPSTGQCKDAGGWDCYDENADLSGKLNS